VIIFQDNKLSSLDFSVQEFDLGFFWKPFRIMVH